MKMLARLTLVFAFPLAISLHCAFAEESISEHPILYIGDSISYGKFGATIDTALRKLSAHVTTFASCGSSPSNWLPQEGPHAREYAQTVCGFWSKTGPSEADEFRTAYNPKTKKAQPHETPQLTEELKKIHPKITVVQLGTNIAANRSPKASLGTVREMLQDIKNAGSTCVWIGPPSAHSPVVTEEKITITDQMIDEEATKMGCFYVHTWTFTKAPPGGDGIHPGPQMAVDWADEVLKRIDEKLKQDINAQVPELQSASHEN